MARGAVWSRSLFVEFTQSRDPCPYTFQVTMYGNLIHTVIYMSDRLLTEANPNPRLPHPPDLRRMLPGHGCGKCCYNGPSASIPQDSSYSPGGIRFRAHPNVLDGPEITPSGGVFHRGALPAGAYSSTSQLNLSRL